MNKKIIIGGAIALVVVVITIVAFLFLGKGKDNKNDLVDNYTNHTVEDTVNELKNHTDLSETEMRNELTTELDDHTKQELDNVIDTFNEPIIAEIRDEDNNDVDPDGMKYYGRDEEGNLIEVVDPALGMSEEEALAAIEKLDAAAAAAVAGDDEEYERLILDESDMVPDIPPEDRIDQSIIDSGFVADIDPETGDVNYWNPNTEDYGEEIEEFDYESHKINLEDTKTSEDMGYKPSDWSNMEYGE